jgi:hypothetical protein
VGKKQTQNHTKKQKNNPLCMYKITKNIEQLKRSKKPKLPTAPVSGEEENKKKNK